MNTFTTKISPPLAQGVKISRDALGVHLSDGRMITAPLAWFPRLLHASPEERNSWRLIGNGRGIHWEAVDEDISVESLLFGRGSGESHDSLKRWLESRSSGAKMRLPGRRGTRDAAS